MGFLRVFKNFLKVVRGGKNGVKWGKKGVKSLPQNLHLYTTIVNKKKSNTVILCILILISMCECNTILSAYTKYRHLG